MDFRRISWQIVALGATLFSLIGCQNAATGGELVNVDGESVSMEEFNKYLALKPRVRVDVGGRVVNGTVTQSLGYQGMEDLIRDRIVRHLAKDEGVYPTDAEVANEIEFQKKRNPNFLRGATAQGLDLKTIRSQVSLQLAADHLITKGITVSSTEVDQYIKDHPTEFREPELVDMFWILVTTDDQKKNVDTDLGTGLSFSAVAQKYSLAEGARSQQGRFPQRVLGSLPTPLQTLIKGTPELKATDWVKTTEGWAKFYVDKKTASREIKIDDTIRELVRRQIANQRGSAANDLERRVRAKLLKSKIDIKPAVYQGPWKDQMANLQNTPMEPKKEGAATDAAAPADATKDAPKDAAKGP